MVATRSGVAVLPAATDGWDDVAGDLPARVTQVGLWLGFGAVGFQFAADLFDAFALDDRVANFNAGGEGNLPTWLSAAALVVAASAALLHGLAAHRQRRVFLAAAALLAYLSLDEVVQIHENFDGFGRGTLPDRLAGAMDIVMILPLLAATLLALLAIASAVPEARRLLILGCLALIAAIVIDEGIPAAIGHFNGPDVPWSEELRSSIEEALELCGFVLVATALAAAAVRTLVLRGRRSSFGGNGD
jgi:hypothetical protein